MPVRSLLHYALEIPDQQIGQRYYSDFGFQDVTGASNTVRLRPSTLEREQIQLLEGPKKRLHHLAFAAGGDDFAKLREALKVAGIPEVDPPRGADESGIWLLDPDGNYVNVRDEGVPKPPADEPVKYNGPGNTFRIARRGVEAPVEHQVQPRRLGHVLLFTSDVARQLAFYQDVLGMKLSDRVGTESAFIRCSTDHHNLALVKSSHKGFHHASFEVGGVDEIALGAAQMRDRGWKPAWGLGRHCIGSNFFYYIRDPWGSYAEYFYDMDYIPEDFAWSARDWDPRFSLYLWGPNVPGDFTTNKEE